MALIICSECGKEFSDKAPACPNCGCPTMGANPQPRFPMKSEMDILLESVINKYPNDKNKMAKELRVRLGLNLKEADEVIQAKFKENVNLLNFPREHINERIMDRKRKNDRELIKFFIIFIIFLFCLGGFAQCANGDGDTEQETTEIAEETTKEQRQEEQEVEEVSYPEIKLPDLYKENFITAATSCGMNAEKIHSFKKQGSWENGEKYSFYYDGNTHDLYLCSDGSIDSIDYCQDEKLKIYEKGYESIDVENFKISAEDIVAIQVASEEVIKTSLNYPETVNFDWFTTGSYARRCNYYVTTAEFTAENGFGVKSRYVFRIDCTIDASGSDLVYYELNGEAMYGQPNVPELEKIPIE